MTSLRTLPSMALALAAAALPLAAQTPLFNDGAAFGGSKVFSEGLNPLGNPARFDRSPTGWYLSVVDGDRRSADNTSILQDTLATDPAAASDALTRLKDSPWAMRTRAYGLVGVKEGMNFGFTREETRSEFAYPDLTALGANLAQNLTYLDGRRTVVNRVHFGGGTLSSGTAAGFSVRFEQWEMGTSKPYLALPNGAAPLFGSVGAFPFVYSADAYVMGMSSTTAKTLFAALDFGFTKDLAEGLRLGVMVDQFNAKRLWDVDMKPQYRGALQLDLGPNAKITLESDVNATARMPFPEKQQSTGASLHYQVSPAVVFLAGGERRKIGDASVTRFGATLQLRTQAMLVSFGFQAGQDRPLKGLSLMVN